MFKVWKCVQIQRKMELPNEFVSRSLSKSVLECYQVDLGPSLPSIWLSWAGETEIGSASEAKLEWKGRVDPIWRRSGITCSAFEMFLLPFWVPNSAPNRISRRHARQRALNCV